MSASGCQSHSQGSLVRSVAVHVLLVTEIPGVRANPLRSHGKHGTEPVLGHHRSGATVCEGSSNEAQEPATAHVASRSRGGSCILAAGVLWSLSGVITKSLPLDPLTIAFYRGLFAGLALLPLVPPRRWVFRPVMIPLGLVFGAMTACYLGAVKMTTAANAIYLTVHGHLLGRSAGTCSSWASGPIDARRWGLRWRCWGSP